MANPNLNTDKEFLSPADKEFENNIRPREITDFAGQGQIIENLKIFIKAARLRNEALDHILFCGFRRRPLRPLHIVRQPAAVHGDLRLHHWRRYPWPDLPARIKGHATPHHHGDERCRRRRAHPIAGSSARGAGSSVSRSHPRSPPTTWP